MPIQTANRIALLICAYFVALGLLYSANTPPFEGPDELAHFVYADKIVREGRLPVIPDRDTAFAERNYEVHQLPLYYMAGVPFIALFERADLTDYFRLNPFAAIGVVAGTNENVQLQPIAPRGDSHLALWAMRLMSLAISVFTLTMVYHVGRMVWDNMLGLGAMWLAASIPTFIHVSASANNDNLNAAFCALAACLALRTWTARRITRGDTLCMIVALSGAALTKLTGFAAFGFVVGAHLIGAIVGRYTWRDVLRLFAALGVGVAVLAGWWYVRSVIIYGDPLAFEATLRLWSRGGEGRLPSAAELWGVWVSFWMTLGHLNVPAPLWFTPYASVVALLGFVGVGILFVQKPDMRWKLAYLLCVMLVVAGLMVYTTRRVNISQGRALFTALTALAPLWVIGWRVTLRRVWWLPILPIMGLAVAAPFTALQPAFSPLTTVASLPADAQPLDVRAEQITVHGVRVLTPITQADGVLRVEVYFSGNHPENPAMFITAQNPLTGERLGKIDTYPGMAATDTLAPNTLYRAVLRVPLQPLPEPQAPFVVQLALGWRVPDAQDPTQGRFVQWFNADDEPIGAVFADGGVLQDARYQAGQPPQRLTVTFGDGARLLGYDIQPNPTDETLTVRLWWERVAPIPQDWTLTVGVAAADDTLLSQQDAPPLGYPTSRWLPNVHFVTEHTLDAPAEGAALRVGWYTPTDLVRIPAGGAAPLRDDLLYLPLP